MYRDHEGVWFLHGSLCLRFPIRFDMQQAKLALGITCPRHRRLMKARLGRLGRLLPDLEWTEDEQRMVNVWRRPA